MTSDSKAAQGDWAEQVAHTAMGRHAVDVVALDEVARQLRAAEHRGYTMGHKAGDDFRSAALASTAGAGAGDWVTVPRDAPEAMWGGLARQIVMWCRFGQPTGKALFQHLKSSGYEIPAWLREEVEDVDHVPPKGTIAAIIYRAMIEAAPAVPASPRSETVWDYTHALQSVIWRICNGHPITEDLIKQAPHAAGMAAKFMASSQGGGAGRSEKGEGEGREFFGDLVVIWSERRGSYWKAPDDGTTKDLKRAAVHRRADAEKIAAGCPWLRLIPIAEAAAIAPAQSPSTSDAEG